MTEKSTLSMRQQKFFTIFFAILALFMGYKNPGGVDTVAEFLAFGYCLLSSLYFYLWLNASLNGVSYDFFES